MFLSNIFIYIIYFLIHNKIEVVKLDIEKELRILMLKEDKSVKDVAQALGTTGQNISNKLRRNNLTISTLEDIAKAIGYKVNITFTKI